MTEPPDPPPPDEGTAEAALAAPTEPGSVDDRPLAAGLAVVGQTAERPPDRPLAAGLAVVGQTAERPADRPLAAGLAVVGQTLLRAGVWTGRAAQGAYAAIDPSLRQHLAESAAIGLTAVVGGQTPELTLPDDGQRAVVFVHGLAGHRGNLIPLAKYFAHRGRRRTVSVGFPDKSSIEAMAEQLAAVLRGVLEANELPEDRGLDIVAHSMGGIVSRTALLDDELARRVHRLVTVATPHGGTELARFAATQKTKSLRPGSELLKRLDAQLPWGTVASLPELVCVWSRQDLVLLPPESAVVAGATVVERSECSHNGFLIRPGAIRAIYEATGA